MMVLMECSSIAALVSSCIEQRIKSMKNQIKINKKNEESIIIDENIKKQWKFL